MVEVTWPRISSGSKCANRQTRTQLESRTICVRVLAIGLIGTGRRQPARRLLPLRVLDLHDLGFLAARRRARHVQRELAAPVGLGRGHHPLSELRAVNRADAVARVGQRLGLGVVGSLQDAEAGLIESIQVPTYFFLAGS